MERYLTTEEIRRLGQALDDFEVQYPSDVLLVRLLLLTGCRCGEILTLQWQWVDFERELLLLPDSKTGQKTVVLNKVAVDLLRSVERVEGNPYVVISPCNSGQNLNQPTRGWGHIRHAAGLDDVRLHDLRHTFASIGVSANYSLPIIGKSLGHCDPKTTARYAHLDVGPVRAMVEDVGSMIGRAAGMVEPSPAVSPLRLELDKPLAEFDPDEREALWGRLCELQGGLEISALELARA